MAKFKRKHKAQTHGRPPASTSSFGPSHAKPTRSRRRAASAPSAPSKPSRSAQQPPPRLAVPFAPADRILLVGEGDFSFAAALLAHHRCAHLTATTPDAAAALLDKHPQAAAHIRALRAAPGCRVVHGVDAGRMRRGKALGTNPAGWDTVVFNFPHVGGRSTDVNRQVRYNQELLVAFFTAAIPLLAPGKGKILVTLFEGEPYTLWNIRDLARHVGLRVETSFAFRAEAYPGYRHARTLGNVESVGGTAWKGENRPARTYVFRVVGADGDGQESGGAGRKKRKRRCGDDSDDDDDSND